MAEDREAPEPFKFRAEDARPVDLPLIDDLEEKDGAGAHERLRRFGMSSLAIEWRQALARLQSGQKR